jgi:ketopantoate reductase
LAITTRVNTWRFLGDADAALVFARLVRESGALAAACNIPLTDESMLPAATMCRGSEQSAADIVRAIADDYRINAPDHRLSTLQDLEARRPLEIEETLGHAVARAAKLGLELPLIANLHLLARAIDRLRQDGGKVS